MNSSRALPMVGLAAVTIFTAVLAFFVVVSWGIGTAETEAAEYQSTEFLPSVDEGYEVNDAGQTFGSVMNVEPGHEPDLILVIGVDGNEGYVTKADWLGPEVTTPEEALEYMDSDYVKNGVLVPVYESDGVTQIDVFPIGPLTP